MNPKEFDYTQQTFSKKLYTWSVVFLSALFLFYKYVLQVSPSVMANELMHKYAVTGAGLGNLAACYFYTFLIMQLPVGILLDRFNPRHLSALAIAICALGTGIFATTNSLLVAEIARALIGFGAAFATVSYMKLVTIWFPPRLFSFLAGLLASAAMLGAMGGEMPLAWLVGQVGWQVALKYCAVVGMVFAIVFWLVIRVKDDKPHALEPHLSAKGWFSGILQVIKNPQNWLLSLYSGLAFAPTDVFAGLWGVPYLMESYHLSRTIAASEVSCIFVGLAIGSPILGWFADRTHQRRKVMQWGALIAFVSLTLAIYTPHLSLYIMGGLLFIFGIGTSAFMLGFTLGKEANHIALAATVVAFINASDALWGAISEPLIGKLLDWHWTGKMVNGVRYFSLQDYHWALMILPMYLLGAYLLIFAIKERKP